MVAILSLWLCQTVLPLTAVLAGTVKAVQMPLCPPSVSDCGKVQKPGPANMASNHGITIKRPHGSRATH